MTEERAGREREILEKGVLKHKQLREEWNRRERGVIEDRKR